MLKWPFEKWSEGLKTCTGLDRTFLHSVNCRKKVCINFPKVLYFYLCISPDLCHQPQISL